MTYSVVIKLKTRDGFDITTLFYKGKCQGNGRRHEKTESCSRLPVIRRMNGM